MRRASCERPPWLVVQEWVDGVGPADRLVQVRENPDVREPVEICETAAVRLGEEDPGRGGVVGGGLERHAVERRVPRDDVTHRLVVDRASTPFVEQRLDERSRSPRAGKPPNSNGPLEARRRSDPCGESVFAADQQVELGLQQRRWISARTIEEEELQEQLRAKVADMLGRNRQPALESALAAR